MSTSAGWRRRELRREAARNALDPRSRHGILVAVALALGLGLAGLLGAEWRALDRDLDALEASGHGVLILEGADAGAPAAIDVASCRRLADLPVVARAGAVRRSGSDAFVQLGPLVPLVEADPALVPGLRRAPAVVGSELASLRGTVELLAADGRRLEAIPGPREPSGLAGLNSSVTVALPTVVDTAARCAVVLERFAAVAESQPMLLAALEADAELVAVPAAPRSHDPAAAYLARVTRGLPVAVGLLGGAFGLVLLRTRGSELAAYRLSGTARADLVRLLLLEQALLAGVLVAAGAAGILAQFAADPAPPPALPAWILAAGCAWLVAAGPGILLMTRASPTDLARDR